MNYLTTPIPNQTLVWLRIALGLLGGGDILGNGIYYHWYKGAFDDFTFRYYGFEWVHPLPEPFFSMFFIGGFLLGLAVAVGWRFRVTAPLFALAFTYLFLLEKAHYLNHAYLFCWLAWLLAFTPAWREWSLDVRRNPLEWSPVTPRWSLAIFPLLMGVVYFWGGIAKLNYDWLIEAMPLHLWIKNRSDIPIVGPLFALKPTAYLMAWGGFLLDLLIAFFLLHKRLRWWALAAAVFFHATNHLIFNIGIFPYLSLVMTSLFFEPDWPGKFVNWLAKRVPFIQRWQTNWRIRISERFRPQSSKVETESSAIGKPHAKGNERSVEGEDTMEQAGRLVSAKLNNNCYFEVSNLGKTGERERIIYTGSSPFWGNCGIASFAKPSPQLVFALTALVGLHLFLPLRHHYFDSDVAWSEEGHRYSWRMMLRAKSGYGTMRVVDRKTGKEEVVNPQKTLNKKQARKLVTHPDMILQYAHYLGDKCGDCAVYADIQAKLNNGKYNRYIDPTVDLTQLEWGWLETKPWILKEIEK